MEEVIRDGEGTVIQRSKNMRGIRRYVSNHLIDVLSIDLIADAGGKLCILFKDRSSYETNFSCFYQLLGIVGRWRNLYGETLRVKGEPAGKVSYDNPALNQRDGR